MKMKTRVDWAGHMSFVGTGKNGHGVLMDGGKDIGGFGVGASPMELLLMGAGGCASIDIVMILQKARQEITDVSVEVEGDRNEEMPKVFNAIHLNFVITGKNLNEKQVERAVELSMTKYCSVSLTLAKGVDMSWGYTMVEAA